MTITLDSLTVTTGSGGTRAVLKIHNSSGSVTLSTVTVAVRDSAGNNLDYPDVGPVTVGTTQYTYDQTKTFANGTYTMFGAYQTSDGVWHNLASQSVTVGAVGDTTPPSTPTNLAASSTASVLLTWSASTDNVGVVGYYVYRNGTQIANVTGTSYTDNGRPLGTVYTYTVKAYDAAGNLSNAGSLSVTTPNSGAPSDTTPPTVPTGLASSSVTSSSLTLSWTASTDPDSSVSGYHVFRGGTQVASVSGTSFADTGLSASTNYSYTVNAYDPSGNTSAQSSALSVTTSASGGGGGAGTRLGKNNFFYDDFASLDTSNWTLNRTSSYPNDGPDNPNDTKVDYFNNAYLSVANSIAHFTSAPSNITLSSGKLAWYCAFLTTEYSPNGVQAQTGDYLEAKVMFNAGSGAWPAFWTWANGNGEIDVFEYHPDNPNLLELTNHVGSGGNYYTNASAVAPGKWVTIGALCGASSVDWYVNGTKVYSDNSGVGSGWAAYLNLNLSMSDGTYHPDPTVGESPTPDFQVDYVGIWR